ncbi:MAG: M16 family metallopeptidase [Myxococcaceae bacterium]
MRRPELAVFLALTCCATVPATVAPVAAPPPWTRTTAPAALPALARHEPATRMQRLANGLQVVVIEHHRRPVVSARLVFRVGAASEPPDQAGSTWLAISLLGDTYDRRTGGTLDVVSEKPARRQIAEAGGQFRSRVTSDSSWIGIDGYSVDTSRYLGMLARLTMNPRHGEDSFAGRRAAMQDAIDDLALSENGLYVDRLSQLAFGPDHVYARPLIGNAQTLAELHLDQVVKQQARALRPDGTTLLVVGDVDPEAVLKQAAEVFGRWRWQREVEPPKVELPAMPKRRAVLFVPRQPARATSLCAVRPLSDVNAPDAVLDVLAEIIGDGRLRESLRERRGLTYHTSAEILRHRHARTLVACTSLRAAETTEGLRIFLQTLAEAGASPFAPAEVERAKEMLIGRLEGGDDDVASSVHTWLTSFDLGWTTSPGERIAALRSVTAEEVQQLAGQLLKVNGLHLALSGEPGLVEPAFPANGLGFPTQVRAGH